MREQETVGAQICLFVCVCVFISSFSSMLAFLRLFCHDTQDRHQLSSCTALPLAPAAILVQVLLALVCLGSHNTLLKEWKTP